MPELQFKGKEFVYNHHLSVPFRPLVPDATKSIVEAGQAAKLDGNLVIHGDNLHALKALLPMYAGKVDCIFIDPPYNTGNESWSYNDNVNSPMFKEWLASNPINKDDLLRHDKWCCMIYPRLRLLKELLSPSGYIGVTIDDNELQALLLVMNEVFGEDNKLACAVWLSDPSGGKQKTALRCGHEYFVIYGGGDPNLRKEEAVELTLNLEDKKGCYAKGRELNKWGANSERKDRPSMYFPLKAPDGTDVYPIRNDGKEGCWRFGDKSSLVKSLLKDSDEAHWEVRPFDAGVTVDGKSERWVPYEKIRDVKKAFGWSTWLDDVATNASGTEALKQVFGTKVFETPKPVELIEWFIGLSGDSDCTVLDSFAGSGTTGQAVLSLNAKDGGERKLILIEGEDYADKVTAERVRRVMQGYAFTGTQKTELLRESISFTTFKNAHKLMSQVAAIENLHGHEFDKITKTIKDDTLIVVGEKGVQDKMDGLGGTFTYCTLGDPIDLKGLLSGSKLPAFEQIGGWLYNTATNEAFNPANAQSAEFFLGESAAYNVWLYYKPDLDFLKSRDAALTLQRAEEIAAKKPFGKTGKRNLVFAPAKFAPNKALHALGVEYAPLPFALFKIDR